MQTEVYVIAGMMVPILLSEDFMLLYKVTFKRDLEAGLRMVLPCVDEKVLVRPVD
jgi:hypothetical protein